MRITRKTLKQSGAALEEAVRRDMNGAMGAEMDRVVFLGSGANGEPLGVVAGAATYGITSTAIDTAASWAAFRGAVTRFLTANAAGSASAVRAMLRPEVWASLDGMENGTLAKTEWERLTSHVPAQNIVLTNNALDAPAGATPASTALLTTSAGGVAPVFVGMWGAIDLIRDPFSDAQSGGLRITALATMDVTISRAAQLEVLTGIQ